ncbi:MAG: DUF1559 domain-containing protein, partial [Pirellulaceae bacterium]|nr:DUF1559 domain-containing protein [Pirellulaceae bacterium]
WNGGGTDYGGCAGRHSIGGKETGYAYFQPNQAGTIYTYPFIPSINNVAVSMTEATMKGIFGDVNKSATFSSIRDGSSNTFLTGELQRLTDVTPPSMDGWVIGGIPTLFTTGCMTAIVQSGSGSINYETVASGGKMMNNKAFVSPGSEHSGGAHMGLADGSARFFSESMDATVFALMGSMADGYAIDIGN